MEDNNGAAQAAEDQKLAELLDTPITEDEAKKEFANAEVIKAQLRVARQRTMYEITQRQLKVAAIDEQLLVADMNTAVTYRRALNVVEKPDAAG